MKRCTAPSQLGFCKGVDYETPLYGLTSLEQYQDRLVSSYITEKYTPHVQLGNDVCKEAMSALSCGVYFPRCGGGEFSGLPPDAKCQHACETLKLHGCPGAEALNCQPRRCGDLCSFWPGNCAPGAEMGAPCDPCAVTGALLVSPSATPPAVTTPALWPLPPLPSLTRPPSPPPPPDMNINLPDWSRYDFDPPPSPPSPISPSPPPSPPCEKFNISALTGDNFSAVVKDLIKSVEAADKDKDSTTKLRALADAQKRAVDRLRKVEAQRDQEKAAVAATMVEAPEAAATDARGAAAANKLEAARERLSQAQQSAPLNLEELSAAIDGAADAGVDADTLSKARDVLTATASSRPSPSDLGAVAAGEVSGLRDAWQGGWDERHEERRTECALFERWRELDAAGAHNHEEEIVTVLRQYSTLLQKEGQVRRSPVALLREWQQKRQALTDDCALVAQWEASRVAPAAAAAAAPSASAAAGGATDADALNLAASSFTPKLAQLQELARDIRQQQQGQLEQPQPPPQQPPPQTQQQQQPQPLLQPLPQQPQLQLLQQQQPQPPPQQQQPPPPSQQPQQQPPPQQPPQQQVQPLVNVRGGRPLAQDTSGFPQQPDGAVVVGELERSGGLGDGGAAAPDPADELMQGEDGFSRPLDIMAASGRAAQRRRTHGTPPWQRRRSIQPTKFERLDK